MERLRTLAPPWIKDAGDVLVTIGIIVLVLGAATLLFQNRTRAREAKVLAAEVAHHQKAEAQTAVRACYDRRASYLALRPVIVAMASSPSEKIREAGRNYLATISEIAPRLSDCRRLAVKLGVAP